MKGENKMDHVVYLDAKANEFEKLINGSKSMIIRVQLVLLASLRATSSCPLYEIANPPFNYGI